MPHPIPDPARTSLYEQDFYAWTQEQANLLRQGKWHQLSDRFFPGEPSDLMDEFSNEHVSTSGEAL